MTNIVETIARAIEEATGYGDGTETARDIITDLEANGYAIVPIEPTEAMIERGLWEAESCTDDWTSAAACLPGHVYSTMISIGKAKG